VLVVERGGCERSSLAGHPWPAEWARKEAFKLCPTFDVGQIAKNPSDSRTIAAFDRSSESPPNGEESRQIDVCHDKCVRALDAQQNSIPVPVTLPLVILHARTDMPKFGPSERGNA
jgi:hypothetical protein